MSVRTGSTAMVSLRLIAALLLALLTLAVYCPSVREGGREAVVPKAGGIACGGWRT
ncbi:MAG: hypothetical protein QME60_06930 [Verrucomicrobiota bacterium]|nr:hypothetical protein [Verrucomicrobiota bacterium]